MGEDAAIALSPRNSALPARLSHRRDAKGVAAD